MSTTSIIVLTVLGIIIGSCVLVFYTGQSISFYLLEKSYKRFLEDKENLSDDALLKLQRELDTALDQLSHMVSNQKDFISGNDNEYSEYETDVPDAREDLAKKEERKARFDSMLQEVNREIARREHSHKYK